MVSGKLLQCLTDTNIKIKGAVRKIGCKLCRLCHPELVEGSQGTAKETIDLQQCSETLRLSLRVTRDII